MYSTGLTVRTLGPPPDGVGGLEALRKTIAIGGSRGLGSGRGTSAHWRGRAGPASGVAVVVHGGRG